MHSLTRYPLLTELTGGLEGWAVAYFCDHLSAQSALAAVDDDRRHLWLLVWSQMSHRAERVDAGSDLPLWRERLQSLSFRAIAGLAGFTDSLGLRRCVRRLGWRALLSARAYLTLADALASDGPAAKVLRHAKIIDQRTIHLLPVFMSGACSPALAQALIKDRRIKADHARRVLWRLEQVRATSPDVADRLEASFKSGRSAFDDEAWVEATFPPPPWEGTDRLVPLDSQTAVVTAAAAFKNCISHYRGAICRGERYFYRFGDVAIVEFHSVSGIGWEVDCYLGKSNKPVSEQERRELEAELAGAPGHICKTLPNKPMWEA